MSEGQDFPPSVILKARRLAHFRCCYCRQHPGDEVHHITPREEGGAGTIENAVLLCVLCHKTYGHSAEYRKRIEQARDHWYEVAAKMYSAVLVAQAESESQAPAPMTWLQVQSRFDQIRGEVWVIWTRREEPPAVEWSVYPRDHSDKRVVPMFLAEARLAGRMIADIKTTPRKFPGLTWDDPADTWINAVAGLVPSDRFSGSGQDEKGPYASGSLEDVVQASRIACGRLATEFAPQASSAPSALPAAARASMIDKWREMVRTIHRQSRMSKNANRSITSLLELNPDFLRFVPHLSERSRSAVYGNTIIVSPGQSEMSGTLHSILSDIAELERQWGLG